MLIMFLNIVTYIEYGFERSFYMCVDYCAAVTRSYVHAAAASNDVIQNLESRGNFYFRNIILISKNVNS